MKILQGVLQRAIRNTLGVDRVKSVDLRAVRPAKFVCVSTAGVGWRRVREVASGQVTRMDVDG